MAARVILNKASIDAFGCGSDATKPKYRCPNCGNTSELRIDDNGLEPDDEHFTLLCTARVKPLDVANYDAELTEVGPDGLSTCGMQWCPGCPGDES